MNVSRCGHMRTQNLNITSDDRSTRHPSMRTVMPLVLLVALTLSSCSVTTPFARSATPTVTSGRGSPHPAVTPTPATASASLPLFDSTTAVKAMQAWASEVNSGRIVDGLATHTPSNSGWIRDWNHLSTYVPYGAYTSANTFSHAILVVVIGSIEYIFAYRDPASAPGNYQYGMMLGTISDSGLPLTLLVWISNHNQILLLSTSVATGDFSFTNINTPRPGRFGAAHDSDVALFLASRRAIHRTIGLEFVTQFTTSSSAPSSIKEIMSRNNSVLAQVEHPTHGQARAGVFAGAPSGTLAISPQDGAEDPWFIVLPPQPVIGF